MPTDRPGQLSWGLLIATKDRVDELEICIRLALEQTRPLVEVIVVDASAAWEEHARRIGAIVGAHPEVRFVYLQADVPSLTVQRNQAIAAAEADIVFMIDDDSFMHSDCAERIMEIYEADREGVVAGVQTSTGPMPGDVKLEAPQKQRGKTRFSSNLGRWIGRKIFVLGAVEGFIPYDRTYYDRPIPATLSHLPVAPTLLFGGARMTYRREAIAASGFDPVLRFYCPFEDNDASYRVSRRGMILTSLMARLHHYTTASGRIDRRRVAKLGALNQAVLLRRHAADLQWARRAYMRLMARRIVAEFLKDLLSRRLSFPQLRGLVQALGTAPQVFAMPDGELEPWYTGMQTKIVKGS